MRWAMLAAAAVALVLAAASPAWAGYGAFALDQAAHKYGYSANQPDQQRADRLAVKNCKSANCKVVFPVGPRKCGALATGDKATGEKKEGTPWGGAVRPTRAAAALAAMNDCQKHTSGHCKVRAAACNR